MDKLGWTPIGAIRFAGQEVLYFRADILASGFYLSRPDVNHCRFVIIFCNRSGRSSLVWLRLSTNCMDRSVFVDGAPGGRRPQQTYEAGCIALEQQ